MILLLGLLAYLSVQANTSIALIASQLTERSIHRIVSLQNSHLLDAQLTEQKIDRLSLSVLFSLYSTLALNHPSHKIIKNYDHI